MFDVAMVICLLALVAVLGVAMVLGMRPATTHQHLPGKDTET